MARQRLRVRIDGEGRLEIVDPGFDTLPLARELDPAAGLAVAPLAGFVAPRVLRCRFLESGIDYECLAEEPDDRLWEAHDEGAAACLRGAPGPRDSKRTASLLDVKVELTRRLLKACRLCADRCGVDRTRGELGRCRLGTVATVAEHFVHVAEEPPINPSLVLNLSGCGLRCRYCQQGALLDPAAVEGDALEASLWAKLETAGARSLSFVGGNPDESLYGILRFLAAAPSSWALPLVWNCHAYTTPDVLRLLAGVVDVFLPDLKYGSEACGRGLSGVAEYPVTAKDAVARMLGQDVPVIVRILVLPGHVECCHKPVLEWLAALASAQLLVSIRAQYAPDWKITPADGELARRVTPAEVRSVQAMANALGLRLVNSLVGGGS